MESKHKRRRSRRVLTVIFERRLALAHRIESVGAGVCRQEPVKVTIVGGLYSAVGKSRCQGRWFVPAPMLGMSVGKRQNLALVVPGSRTVLPRTRAGREGEIAIVKAVLPFIDENERLRGRGPADIRFFQIGRKAGDDCHVATHLAAHGNAADFRQYQSANPDGRTIGWATVDSDAGIVCE